MKGKTKDNIKARMDITMFCHRKYMELVYAGSWVSNISQIFMDSVN